MKQFGQEASNYLSRNADRLTKDIIQLWTGIGANEYALNPQAALETVEKLV